MEMARTSSRESIFLNIRGFRLKLTELVKEILEDISRKLIIVKEKGESGDQQFNIKTQNLNSKN